MAKLLKFFVLVFLVSLATSKPADGEKKSRIVKKDLSRQEHFHDSEHNPDYDHEAFLGEDEAEVFDHLTPEESKRRLSILVDRIDRDENGNITVEELKQWIDYTQKRYIADDVKKQWDTHNVDKTEEMTWETYKEAVYGFLKDMDAAELQEDGATYTSMQKRDERRWGLADRDENGALNQTEFTDFLHPEESEHMKDVVIVETMEDIDADEDGRVSESEYIGDMYEGKEDETEPDWVNSEREQFAQFRDKDGDGFMDKEEIRAWITPPDYDHSLAEAKHLMEAADEDGDGFLDKDEVMDKYDVFVGSQVTDFGEALNRHTEF